MPMTQPPSTVIENIEQLKEYLQAAVKLEHATVPPYLTAAYSAKVEKNKASMDIIRAVAKEEMLHLTLAANLLNGIGGEPDIVSPDFVPNYPAPLPTGQDDFMVGIERFSDSALRIFLDIERPTSLKPEQEGVVQHIQKVVPISGRHVDQTMLKKPIVPIEPAGDDYELHYDIAVVPHDQLTEKRRTISEAGDSLIPHVPPQSSDANGIVLHYWNIGEFYKAIHLGFVELTNKLGMEAVFTGDRSRQIDPKYFFSAGGESVVVTDLRTALMAVDLIAGQGEGSNNRVYDSAGELAHYYRFDQIRRGQYYRDPKRDGSGDEADHPKGVKFEVHMDQVFPIRANAKMADYKGHPELEENALLFNGRYKRFLETLNKAFNGHPELLGAAFHSEMWGIRVAMERLIKNPIPGTHENAAPTFEMKHFKYPPAEPASAVTPTTVATHA